jgi:hypothetical protein
MSQTVVLGPLYDPLITDDTVAFTYKDDDDYCGGVIKLEPDRVYRVWVSNGEFYVEYEVDGEVDGLLKKLVVGKPPVSALYIDCSVGDYHEGEFDFERRCKFVSIEEFYTRRVLRFLEGEFGVGCPKGVVKDWVENVVESGRDWEWMLQYVIKHAGNYNSSNQVESCKWLATVALLYLRVYDMANYQPKDVKDLYRKIVYCRVRRRVDLFKAGRDPGVFVGLDKELGFENLVITA